MSDELVTSRSVSLCRTVGQQKSWTLLPCISYGSRGHNFCDPLYISVKVITSMKPLNGYACSSRRNTELGATVLYSNTALVGDASIMTSNSNTYRYSRTIMSGFFFFLSFMPCRDILSFTTEFTDYGHNQGWKTIVQVLYPSSRAYFIRNREN